MGVTERGGVPLLSGKRSCLKRIRCYDVGKEGTLLLSSDKNSVIAENVLSYSLCLSSKFEVQFAPFGAKQ